MNYEQWIEYIKTNKDPLYWERIVSFAPEIAMDIKEYKHHIVSKKIGFKHSTSFSIVKPLILAIASREEATNATNAH